MACTRLARAAAAHLRRGVSPPFAPARTFSASCSSACPPVANPTLLGRHAALQRVWSRYSSSSPAFQARAPKLGAFLAARLPLGVRPQLPGLLKGFGTGTGVAMMLYPKKAADARERLVERPPEDITVSSGYLKHLLSELWSLVRKYQMPVALILLTAFGWRNPISLAIYILLLLYCSRPNPYSIYLFLHEIHEREMHRDPALWREKFLQTRKVDAEDYKFFSIGTVELKDKTVLHAIGIMGNWWIYHVSYVKDMGGRNIGVAVDFSSCSKAALRWASTNITRNGDQLILIHVNNSCQNEQGAVHLWEQSGSPLIPLVEFSDPHVTKTYSVSPDKETLEILTQVANQRGVEVFGKIFYGDPTKKLCESVDLVPLNCLVIGSRGLSTLKRALMGSVSTYVVNHATCPVTVVKDNM